MVFTIWSSCGRTAGDTQKMGLQQRDQIRTSLGLHAGLGVGPILELMLEFELCLIAIAVLGKLHPILALSGVAITAFFDFWTSVPTRPLTDEERAELLGE